MNGSTTADLSIWHLAWVHDGTKRSQSIDRTARCQLVLDYDNDNDNENENENENVNSETDGRE